MICNACGKEAPGSKEHVIHVAIGRVIAQVGSEVPGGEVRRRLRQGRIGQFEMHQRDAAPRPAFLADKVIQDLLCRDCNRLWANNLEIEAARELAIFLADRRRAGGDLLRRWAAFFALKAWWIDRRTTPLREGPLRPVFEALTRPNASLELPIRVARIDRDPDRWLFALWVDASNPPLFRSVAWVTRSVLWVLLAQPHRPDRQPFPFRTRELGSLYLRQLPVIRPRDLFALPALAKTFPRQDLKGTPHEGSPDN